jgi:hypothetical protein
MPDRDPGNPRSMTWILNTAGALLVLVALRDIFHTLWHPRGFGSLGRKLFALVWRLTRGADTELSGPVGLLVVVTVWAAMIVAGWTLVYLPHMPEHFSFSGSLHPVAANDLVSSTYLSLVAVATLGFGDIVPTHPGLKLLVPLEALIGFVLFTAAISWVLQVYPALTRRRSLAHRLALMARTGTAEVVRTGDPGVVLGMLDSVVDDLLEVRVDLLQYGESYYFREEDADLSLAATLPYALSLADAARANPSPEAQHAGAVLQEALASTSDALESFLGEHDSTPDMLDAFARDHHHRPVTPAAVSPGA